MKISSIFKCLITMILIITILTQCISALSQERLFNNTKPCNWQENNVFFYCHAYSNDGWITNQSLPVICFVKDVNLGTFFEIPIPIWGLFYNEFKVWNDTGLITYDKTDHCHFGATNFTGIIIHRKCLLGYYVWFIYGYCNILKVSGAY